MTDKLATVAEILATNRRHNGAIIPLVPKGDDVRNVIAHPAVSKVIDEKIEDVKAVAAHDAAAYYLHAQLMAAEAALGGTGNTMAMGRILDDTLTHFLASLKAELGAGYAENAAALMIRNLALWLKPERRDHILDYLKVVAK